MQAKTQIITQGKKFFRIASIGFLVIGMVSFTVQFIIFFLPLSIPAGYKFFSLFALLVLMSNGASSVFAALEKN